VAVSPALLVAVVALGSLVARRPATAGLVIRTVVLGPLNLLSQTIVDQQAGQAIILTSPHWRRPDTSEPVGVVGNDVATFADRAKQDAFGGASLVSWDHVFEPGNLPHRALKLVERAAAGIALVSLQHAAPLSGAHRAGAGVGQQVDEHIVGMQHKQIKGCCG
jgi:hypothetical protein